MRDRQTVMNWYLPFAQLRTRRDINSSILWRVRTFLSGTLVKINPAPAKVVHYSFFSHLHLYPMTETRLCHTLPEDTLVNRKFDGELPDSKLSVILSRFSIRRQYPGRILPSSKTEVFSPFIRSQKSFLVSSLGLSVTNCYLPVALLLTS